jgi:TonB family protein
MTRLAFILMACIGCLVNGEASAQRSKSSKQTKTRSKGTEASSPAIKTSWVYYDVKNGTQVNPAFDAQVGRAIIPIPQPEPLIGIHYLLEYPKEAQAAQVQGTVTYTVKVREGKVIDAKIERPDNMYLTTAVLEAANKLQFDQSWHEPNKPEFTYTRSVEFTLPDQIHSLMPPLILEKQ